jgi:hypothetical protein
MKKLYGLSGRTDDIVAIIYTSWVYAFGSVDAAHFMFMMSRWHGRGGRSDGFIYKSREDIEKETTLKRGRQESVVKHLKKLGVIETALLRADGHATLHYRLNVELAQQLIDEEQAKIDERDRS